LKSGGKFGNEKKTAARNHTKPKAGTVQSEASVVEQYGSWGQGTMKVIVGMKGWEERDVSWGGIRAARKKKKSLSQQWEKVQG